MAHIIYRPVAENQPAMQLIINGIDYSADVYAEGVELVDMSKYEGDVQEIGLRITFALDSVELGGSTPAETTGIRAELSSAVSAIVGAIEAASDRNAADVAKGVNVGARRGSKR